MHDNFKKNKCKNFEDYAKLKTCISEVVKSFVIFCIENFKLSPLHCVGLPSFIYATFLFSTGEKFENLKCI